jgi:hypothetical protein
MQYPGMNEMPKLGSIFKKLIDGNPQEEECA